MMRSLAGEKDGSGAGAETKRPKRRPEAGLRWQESSAVPMARREIILSGNPCPIPIDFRFLTALARKHPVSGGCVTRVTKT